MSADSVAPECWIWYPIAISTVAARYGAQWIAQSSNKGWSKFRPDDFIMLFATLTYTASVVCLYMYDRIADYVNYNIGSLNDDDLEYREWQMSVIALIGETSYDITLWSNKLCMLLIYQYLTRSTARNTVLVVSYSLMFTTFVTAIAILYTECVPFYTFFTTAAISSHECMTWIRYYIVQVVLNVSTSFYLIVLFWVLLIRLNLPVVKKIFLLCIFSLGLFGIVCAILTRWFSLGDIAHPSLWLKWLTREVSTVMMVGNLTLCYPLVVASYRLCKAQVASNPFLRTSIWTQATDIDKDIDKSVIKGDTLHS